MDTIFALSSGHGMAGVAVVRLSGPDSKSVALALTNLKEIQPRYAHFARFLDPETHNLIDTGLVLYFPNPDSFTGEDVVEIQIHGSRAVLEKLYAVLEKQNLRPACPGEFTLRAVENQKMDLVQAEGLLDLIHAQTQHQREQALTIQKGALSEKFKTWREEILALRTFAEANIDFAEEPLPADMNEKARVRTQKLIDSIEKSLSNQSAQLVREGISVALIGAPNAGKSSLFNKILGREAAIISSIAGTTRDIVEATLSIKGYEVSLADTAGLRDTSDTIEKEGVKRALAKAEQAQLQIYVVGDPDSLDQSKVTEKTLIVLNKSDLHSYKDLPQNSFVLSAETGEGFDAFLKAFEEKILSLVAGSEDASYTNTRHKHYLEKTVAELKNSLKASQDDLRAEHLRYGADALGELVGFIETDEILGQVFSNFCIGK